jgi:hypothetical protein
MAAIKGFTRKQTVVLASALGVPLICATWFWWTRPPQMGADAAVFRAVDGLFTAVTARDEKLLGQCDSRLKSLRDAGKLPTAAARYLDGVIERARQGRWQSAAERLYDFMARQRRDPTAADA